MIRALTILALFSAIAATAQDNVIAIKGGRIVTLAGEPIENGTIIIRDGWIAEVGANVAVPAGVEVIDASGLEVYPGMMDAVSRLGLTEVGSTAATVDTTELGDYNPQLTAATAVHPSSEHIPVARANGITHAVTAPGGSGGFGVGGTYGIHGQASLLNLAGWTIEEMAVDTSVGMILHWPTIQTSTFDFSTFSRVERKFSEVKEEYENRVAELEDWMDAARRYAGDSEKEPDLKLEALAKVVEGELPMMIMADDARDIKRAMTFAEEQSIEMILLSGRDAWKEKELLAERNIPVILGPTLTLPRTEDEAYDKPLTAASELQAAGVRVIFASYNSANSRLLPYEVGNAVGRGLAWEEGLKGITLYPAELFGVADELGSIEEGKRANLIITDGDPLEIRTEIRHLLIDGVPTSLNNKHLELYEKYRARR